MNDSPPVLDLDKIQELTSVSEGKAKHLKESCVWALDQCDHTTGVRLRVQNGSGTSDCAIEWLISGSDMESVRRSYNRDDATQYGAEAVALLLSIRNTQYDAVERSVTGTGIDYWLGHKTNTREQPFQKASRLEISGIMKESKTNKVTTRVKQKTSQTRPTDAYSSAHVIVVEFATPYATVHLKQGSK